MASRLTLLCPSYERQNFLARSFRFWSDLDDVRVLYADGSRVPIELKGHNLSNQEYYHQPVGIRQRVDYLLSKVQTPYACMLCDDEFFISSALQKCVDYLELNPDYVACMGRAVGFSRLNDQVVLTHQYPRLRDRVLSHSFAFNRLENHFSSYVPAHCYAVMRTDVLRAAVESSSANKMDLYALGELIREFLIVSKGKSIVLPILYWLRSHEVPPVLSPHDLARDPRKRFTSWWQTSLAVTEKIEFCHFLSEASSGSITPDDVEQILDLYVDDVCGNTATYRSSLRRQILLAIPDPIRKYLRTLNAHLRNGANPLNYSAGQNFMVLQELRAQGVMIDDAGLAKCLNSIQESWRQ